MANGSNRDVKLTLNVGALGEENITKLQKSLTALADEGGKGAEDFAQLADQIGRLGDQNQALQSFKALSDRNEELRQKVDSLGDSFDQLKVKVGEAKDAQAVARAEADRTAAAQDAARRAVVESRNAIATLKAEYAAGKVSTDAYGASLLNLTQRQNESRLAVQDSGTDARKAKDAYTALSSEVGKLETQYGRQEKALTSASDAYRKQASGLHEAASAAESLGVQVSDLAAAEATLAESFVSAQRAAVARKESLDEMADADRLAGIQAQTLAVLVDKGAAALLAEQAAFREATEAADKYAQAKAAASAQAADWGKEAHDIVEAVEARQRLTTATERQIEVQRAANAAIAENARNLEAAKQDDFAATVRVLTQELERLEAQEQQVAEATQRLNNSFGKLDSRPISDVHREIAEVRVAMATLASSGQVTGNALSEAFGRGEAKIKELDREIRQLNGTLTIADRAAGLFKNSMGQIAAGNLVADAIGALVEKVKELGREFVAVIARTETFRMGLNAVYKDSALAGSQFEFLRNTAQLAGVSMESLQSSFLKFSASMRAANIPLAESNALFSAVTKASAALGLSGEEVSGMLEALSQMASKGTVSMEELRQQLGDRLPGSLSLVAKGFGITEAELIKLVESGNLAARDMIPALTKSLAGLEGDTDTLNGTWERFKGMLTGVAQDAGDAGWLTILTGALKIFSGIVGLAAFSLSVMWEGLRLVGVGAVALSQAFSSPTEALGFFNEEVAKSIDRLNQQNARQMLALNPNNEYAKSVLATVAAHEKQGVAATNAASDLGKIIPVAAQSAIAIKAQAEVSGILADKTRGAGQQITAITVYLEEQIDAVSKNVLALEKEAKAIAESGAASVALATVRGNELALLEAQAAAANASANAIQKVAVAKKTEVDLLVMERNAIVQATLASGDSLETRKQVLEALDKKIEKSRAENEQAQASLKTMEQDRLSRKLAIETYGNQSAELENLAREHAQLAIDVLAARAAFDQGRISAEQLRVVEEKLAIAAAKHGDALGDRIKLLQSEAALMAAKLQASQSDLEQQAASARASGNLVLAIQKEIEAKELQIKIAKLKAEADAKVAKLVMDEVEAEMERLKISGQLVGAIKVEMEVRLNNAKIKAIEAKASKSVIDGLEQELRNLRQFGSAQGAATQARDADTRAMAENTSEREKAIKAREKEIELQERENALYREKWNIDKAGFSLNTSGGRMSAAAGTDKYVMDAATNAGLSEAEAIELVDRFIRNGQMIGWKEDSKQGGSWWTAVDKAINDKLVGNARNKAETGGTSAAQTNSSGSGKTVTLVIGKYKQNVKVASQSDADALESFLRQLENSAGTST